MTYPNMTRIIETGPILLENRGLDTLGCARRTRAFDDLQRCRRDAAVGESIERKIRRYPASPGWPTQCSGFSLKVSAAAKRLLNTRAAALIGMDSGET